MKLRTVYLGLSLLCATATANAMDTRIANGTTFDGRVVGVTDGDTITVKFDGLPVTVRLAGIDAPEDGQPFGAEARHALLRMTFGKQVRILSWGQDKYDRTLGIVFTDECVNTQLVRNGFAWHYKEYSDSKALADTEILARRERKGLWATPNPIAPWDWRHPDKAPVTAAADPFAASIPPNTGETSNTATRPATQQTPTLGVIGTTPANAGRTVGLAAADKQPNGTTVYVTNSGSKYHRAGCRHLANSRIPVDLKDAVRRYEPCGTCHPPSLATTGSKGSDLGTTSRSTTATATRPATSGSTHWMTTNSRKRHNSGCRYYRNSNGRPCGPTEGVACKICGG